MILKSTVPVQRQGIQMLHPLSEPPLELPNPTEVLMLAFSDALSTFSYAQRAEDLPDSSVLWRSYAISI